MNSRLILVVSFLLFSLSRLASTVSGGKIFNVLNYGASGNNKNDNNQAFMKAWNDACRWEGKRMVLIPPGIYYLGSIIFLGPCNGSMEFVIQGVLRAHTDPKLFLNIDHWIVFRYLSNLRIHGGGLLDGQGASAWPYNHCDTGSCTNLPVSLRLDFVEDSLISNINSINSKSFHFNIFSCHRLNISLVNLSAPGNSPNTDGIHVAHSGDVNISSAVISTGDDCISILSGSQGVHISNVTCGPGHGISVGSLGASITTKENVTGVTVFNCTFEDTLNGVQIKTWADPNAMGGSVADFTYDDIVMKNVRNPIFINQHYCPNNLCNSQGSSKIQISNIRFSNIRGSSSSIDAVKLDCSKTNPCKDIQLDEINLSGPGGHVSANCSNAYGTSGGTQRPPSCLMH